MSPAVRIKVRPPLPEDLPQVLAIENEAFDDPWPPASLLAELKSDRMRRTLIAEAEGFVVGYLMAWRVDVEMHIINIATSRNRRRSGVGRLLLDNCLDEARELGCQVVTLEVRASNTGACEFYFKAGFTRRGLREGYYSDNQEDALILALDLDPVV